MGNIKKALDLAYFLETPTLSIRPVMTKPRKTTASTPYRYNLTYIISGDIEKHFPLIIRWGGGSSSLD